ncbi:MAG TPA: MFS transporter [Syntrophorhabdaceae bacterium]|nr:MFS transporter [Syntrophorhabdaceae bacterium]HQM80213.1 MFS transporter [Syntrophorhabdaceae bacterium]
MAKYNDLRGKALLFLMCLWFLWFINFNIRMIFSPILPIVEDEFAINHAQASGIFAFLSVGYSIAVLVCGLFSGTFGYKRSIFFSMLFLSLISFSIPFVQTFWLLYVFGFFIGLAVGFYLPSAMPLMTEYYSENNWGKVIAIHDTGASISIFSTPLIVLFLLGFFSWRDIFLVLAFVFLAAAIIFFFSCSEIKIDSPPKLIYKDLMRMPLLWLMVVIWIFGIGGNMGIYAVIPLYLTKELGLELNYANTILGISRLGSIGVSILCGFLIDKFNLRMLMFLVLLVTGITTVLMGLVSTGFMGIILFLQALCVTAFFPVGLVAIARAFNREKRSLATGIIFALSIASGGGLIPYLLGLAGDLHSFGLGIAILGIFISLSSLVVFHVKELK